LILYLRFIGDRSIDEKNFGKIQKDRVMEMKKWSSKVKRTHHHRQTTAAIQSYMYTEEHRFIRSEMDDEDHS
jgi:hypothetical protein